MDNLAPTIATVALAVIGGTFTTARKEPRLWLDVYKPIEIVLTAALALYMAYYFGRSTGHMDLLDGCKTIKDFDQQEHCISLIPNAGNSYLYVLGAWTVLMITCRLGAALAIHKLNDPEHDERRNEES